MKKEKELIYFELVDPEEPSVDFEEGDHGLIPISWKLLTSRCKDEDLDKIPGWAYQNIYAVNEKGILEERTVVYAKYSGDWGEGVVTGEEDDVIKFNEDTFIIVGI